MMPQSGIKTRWRVVAWPKWASRARPTVGSLRRGEGQANLPAPTTVLPPMSLYASLRDMVDTIVGGDRGDFYGRAERVRSVPQAERLVADAALTGGGPIAEQAIRQLREAPEAYRRRSHDGSYELRLVTYDQLMIRGVPLDGWRSGWVPVETREGRRLELMVEVAHAGIVGLVGRTSDGGRWPRTWRVTTPSLARIQAGSPWLRLPTAEEVLAEHRRAAQVIERWLADGGLGDAGLVDRWRGLTAEPGASDAAIGAFEAREGFVAPTAYRALLRVANGIDLGHITVLGTGDAYRLDMPGPSRLVISPPDGGGAVVLLESGAVEWIDLDDPAGVGQTLAVDLRTWVVDRLTWSRSKLVEG